MSPTRPVRVRLFGDVTGVLLDRVAAAWPDAQVSTRGGGGDFRAAVLWDADPEEVAAFVTAQPTGWWLHTKASGLPAEVMARIRGRDVVVTNGGGTHGCAVAEHVLALLLAFCKRLPQLLDAQRERAWRVPRAAELRGMTVGVLGLGDLGRATARLLAAFGVRVVGLRRGGGALPDVTRVFGSEQLAEFLDGLDALVVAAPLTGRTRGLIGAAELDRLPGHAVVVNVGRGPIVDQDALIAALRAGRLAGAALDVFDHEPLAPSSALWSLPNVIITPHCADSTPQTDQRCLDLLLDNIARFRQGRPLRNVVDPARGY